MDTTLGDQLLALAQRDLDVRGRLAADGSLYDGYHPEMQAVHEQNAAALDEIVLAHGWPDAAMVAAEAAEAAWLVVQHAISRPSFQRRCLECLQAAAAGGGVPAWQPAMLLDRIRVFEGRPQIYGTSFDWDEAGNMSPLPIEDPDDVDARRAEVGLPPLVEAIARHRARSASEPKPADWSVRQQQMAQWARAVGWR
jgi:hypothetical protein